MHELNKKNNFDALRLIAASFVIISHSYALTGRNEPGFLPLQATMGTIGVMIFFSISGFLVTKSYLRTSYVSIFLKNRFWRIVPGFTGATLFTVFIIGPFNTALSLSDYFSNIDTWLYLTNIIRLIPIPGLQFDYYLPDVFIHNSIHSLVNGSIWTLKIELLFYVVIALFGWCEAFRAPAIYAVFLITLYPFILLDDFKFGSVGFRGEITDNPFGIIFFFSSLLYLYYDKYSQYKHPLFVAVSSFFLFNLLFLKFYFISMILISYMIIYIGVLDIPWLRYITKTGDYSYGLYIYAWPVQKTLNQMLGDGFNLFIFIMLTFLITLLLAIASWHLVEKPFLRNKK